MRVANIRGAKYVATDDVKSDQPFARTQKMEFQGSAGDIYYSALNSMTFRRRCWTAMKAKMAVHKTLTKPASPKE